MNQSERETQTISVLFEVTRESRTRELINGLFLLMDEYCQRDKIGLKIRRFEVRRVSDE